MNNIYYNYNENYDNVALITTDDGIKFLSKIIDKKSDVIGFSDSDGLLYSENNLLDGLNNKYGGYELIKFQDIESQEYIDNIKKSGKNIYILTKYNELTIDIIENYICPFCFFIKRNYSDYITKHIIYIYTSRDRNENITGVKYSTELNLRDDRDDYENHFKIYDNTIVIGEFDSSGWGYSNYENSPVLVIDKTNGSFVLEEDVNFKQEFKNDTYSYITRPLLDCDDNIIPGYLDVIGTLFDTINCEFIIQYDGSRFDIDMDDSIDFDGENLIIYSIYEYDGYYKIYRNNNGYSRVEFEYYEKDDEYDE